MAYYRELQREPFPTLSTLSKPVSILGSDTTIAVEGLFAVGIHKQITIHLDVSFGYVHGV